jgi:MraZ protein
MKGLLVGEYSHILDEKKRISLPKAFRESLGKRLVITRGLDNCLVVYSREGWEAMAARLQSLSYTQAETRGFARFMLSGAAEVEVDDVGRILIPEHQKAYAALKKQVVFTGVSDRVEVWDAQLWSAYKRRIDKDAEKLAKKLGEIGAL